MKRLCVTAALLLVGCTLAVSAAVSRITPRTSSLLKRSSGARYHAEIRQLHEQRRRLSEQLRSFEQQLEDLGFGFGLGAEKTQDKERQDGEELEVALSTEEHPMSCKILIEAEPGAKVIAPCNCQGTLKWIQFSEYNHLRRQEPEKWQVCSLCKAPFRTKQIYNDSGPVALALAAVLDSPKLLRIAVLGSLAALLVTFRQAVFAATTWFINSKYLWQTRFIWAFVVYGGVMIQLMLLRVVAGAFGDYYKRLEGKIRSILTDWETRLLEQSLRVNTSPQAE